MTAGLCGLWWSPAGARAGENTDRCELRVVFRVVGEWGNRVFKHATAARLKVRFEASGLREGIGAR